jgi:hypothetical protein
LILPEKRCESIFFHEVGGMAMCSNYPRILESSPHLVTESVKPAVIRR